VTVGGREDASAAAKRRFQGEGVGIGKPVGVILECGRFPAPTGLPPQRADALERAIELDVDFNGAHVSPDAFGLIGETDFGRRRRTRWGRSSTAVAIPTASCAGAARFPMPSSSPSACRTAA
jgi:hypothetical protein